MVHSIKTGLHRCSPNILINIIMCVRLFHGFYYELFSNIWLLRIVRSYYFVLTFLIIFTNYYYGFGSAYYDSYFTYLYFFKMFEYDFYFLISLFTNNENFTQFCSLVSSFDLPIYEQSKHLKGVQTFLIFLLIYVSNIGLKVRAMYNIQSYFMTMLLFIMFCGINLINFTRIAMFDIIRQNIKALKQTIQSQSISNENDIDTNDQIENIKKYICTYKTLLDSLHCIGHSSKCVMMANLITPLLIIFIMINAFPVQQNMKHLLVPILFDIIISTIMPFVPAVYGGLIDSDVIKIKNVLTSKLITTKDENLRDKVRDTLTFLQLRPCTVTVWRVCALDHTLPTSMISLYTTFFIVMAQFRHWNLLK